MRRLLIAALALAACDAPSGLSSEAPIPEYVTVQDTFRVRSNPVPADTVTVVLIPQREHYDGETVEITVAPEATAPTVTAIENTLGVPPTIVTIVAETSGYEDQHVPLWGNQRSNYDTLFVRQSARVFLLHEGSSQQGEAGSSHRVRVLRAEAPASVRAIRYLRRTGNGALLPVEIVAADERGAER